MCQLENAHPQTPGQQEVQRCVSRQLPMLFWVALALFVVACLQRNPSVAAPDEYKVKAAFVYNFAKFTTWPAEAFAKSDAPFVIGIVGKDPFGGAIDDTMKGKTVETHPVTIRRVKWAEAKDCHLLFVSGSEGSKTRDMDPVKTVPILTVGEVSGFAQRGGIINFVSEDEKIKFEINPEAAKRANLSISSKLLSLAKIVK